MTRTDNVSYQCELTLVMHEIIDGRYDLAHAAHHLPERCLQFEQPKEDGFSIMEY
jgi:hypothetical protein